MIPYSLEWMKVCPFAHWGVVTIPVLLDSWMCKPSLSRECESHHCKGKVPLVHVGSPQAASREVVSQCRVCMSMRSLAKVPCSCCSVPDFGSCHLSSLVSVWPPLQPQQLQTWWEPFVLLLFLLPLPLQRGHSLALRCRLGHSNMKNC